MLQELKKHVEASLWFKNDSRYLLGISGGIDSVVLSHALVQLGLDSQIVFAHCNFSLRGEESDEDAKWVKNWASSLNVELHSISFDTQGESQRIGVGIQEAARVLRYDWFKELINEYGYAGVMTAHHQDDQLETILINLVRGTGMSGLAGMPESDNQIYRPLLGFSRKAIADYAARNSLEWREDSSNQETKYMRNLIRHEITPALKQLNKGFESGFRRTQARLEDAKKIHLEYLESQKIRVLQGDRIQIETLQNTVGWMEVLHYILSPYGASYAQTLEVASLLEADSGRMVKLPRGEVYKDRDHFVLANPTSGSNQAGILTEGLTDIEGFRLVMTYLEGSEIDRNSEVARLDYDRIIHPLSIRPWEEGDRFVPLGMNGFKKVSDFLIDIKMSVPDKRNQLVVLHGSDIVWLVGLRVDDRFKITANTTRTIDLRIEQ